MKRPWAKKSGMVMLIVLAALLETAFAQQNEMPPISLTSRFVVGVGDYAQGPTNTGGPSATIEADLRGYWRDPRILQYAVEPTITVGTVVPGTDMGFPFTGISAMAVALQGSSFPLTVSYSRSGHSYETSNFDPNANALKTIDLGNTNSSLDVGWTLRFRRLPLINFDYRDTDYSSDLPIQYATGINHQIRNFSAHLTYDLYGWRTNAWYQRTGSDVTYPNYQNGGIQTGNNSQDIYGINVSKALPLHSSLGLSADESKSKFSYNSYQTNIEVKNANAFLSSQPTKRLTTNVQANYISNMQGYELLQAISGSGMGSGTTTTGNTVPIGYLFAPYSITTVSGSAGYRIGYGFRVTGAVGESQSTNSSSLFRWGAGPTYDRTWRSGSISASYFYLHYNSKNALVNTGTTASSYNYFDQVTSANSGSVNLNQNLPRQFKLMASAHATSGEIAQNGIPYPNHDYGGLASVTRTLGEWTLAGTFTINRNAADHQLLYNENSSTGIAFSAGFRGLSLTFTHVNGSGLALQMADQLVWVTNPGAITPVLGIPIQSTTSGNTLTGTYHSRKGRLEIQGYWGRYNYSAADQAINNYNVENLRVAYKLRRLRLIAGYAKQSQLFGTGVTNAFDTRLVYFQIERIVRWF